MEYSEKRTQILYQKVNDPLAQLQKKYKTIPDMVASQILVENNAFRKNLPAKKFKVLYKNNLLKSLLQVCAIAAQGNHSLSTPGMPQLVILCLDEPTFNFIENTTQTKGSYIRHSSLINIKLPHDFHFDSVVSTIIHELTHFAVYEVFKNKSRPYHPNDNEGGEFCENMIKTTQKRIAEWKWDGVIETAENRCFLDLIRQVFDNYTADYIHSEIIVRIPQIVALGGEGKAIEFLQNFPELLYFY